MKKILKLLGKVLLVLIGIPIIYLLISLLLTIIPVSEKETDDLKTHTIYLTSNGVHADVILPKNLIHQDVLNDQIINLSLIHI